MARIAGVDLPVTKRIEIGLTYIYGIGRTRSNVILKEAGVSPDIRIKNLTDNSEKPLGQWNTMVVECLGSAIKVWVNGDLVNYGTNCTASKGQIALQAEGAEVEFRKVELTPITMLTGGK